MMYVMYVTISNCMDYRTLQGFLSLPSSTQSLNNFRKTDKSDPLCVRLV